MYSGHLNTYRETAVQTARPVDLIIMLYNGAIRFARTAVAAIEEKDVPKIHNSIIRTQDIVSELRNTLNFEAGEIANRLALLYDYMLERLIEANTRKTAQPLNEVIGMLDELRDTWVELSRGNGKSQPNTSVDVAK